MKSPIGIYALFSMALFLMVSCNKEADIELEQSHSLTNIAIPQGFPEIEFPEDNSFNAYRWELGKALFFDKSLSKDATVSCASCHLPAYAFSDTLSLSFGVENKIGTRNSPSLANIAYHPYFTREGGVPSLEMQILVPVQEHNEFNHNLLDIAALLRENDDYIELSQKAFNREIDPYVITRAIATFERSLISGNSPFDQYFYQNKKTAITQEQKLGYQLFMSDKTNCFQCHSGFNFSNYSFENNGLYLDYSDPGRFRLTNKQEDLARFKVPSLRNIALTAPYMHDGSINTLEEVIEHYNSGGVKHIHKSSFVKPLHLSAEEKSHLLAFLKSLSDETFINNPNFKP